MLAISNAVPFNLMTRNAPSAPQSFDPSAIRQRAANISPATYAAQTHTVLAVLSTGAAVERWGMTEVLNMEPGAIDLTRAKAGLVKVLDSHETRSIDKIIGNLESVRLVDGQLRARIRFAETPAGQNAEAMVSRGELTSLSIGYRVKKWTLIEENNDGRSTYRADEWELMEASFVSVPADPAARVRSYQHHQHNEDPMQNPAPNAPAPAVRAPALTAAQASNIIEESEAFGLRSEAAEICRRDGMTEQAARAELMRAFAESQRGNVIGNGVGRVRLGNSGRDAQMAQGIQDALYARMSGNTPSDLARDFMGMTQTEIARACLEAAGVSTRGWAANQVFDAFEQRAQHTTSDFPYAATYSGASHRILIETFNDLESPLFVLARPHNVPDFKSINLLQMTSFNLPQKVAESGEIKSTSRGEMREAFAVETFGSIFSMSRQLQVNDDLSALADWSRQAGRAASMKRNDVIAELLTANSGNGVNLADGNPIFTTDRGNKAASGAAPDVTTLGVARKTMRDVKDNETYAGIKPKYLVVGSALETAAEQLLAQLSATKVEDQNPFGGKLELLVEPRLTGNSWRVFADSAQNPVLHVAYLNGDSQPHLETRYGWNVLGTEFRSYFDFGCGVGDWRGAFLNAGA